ncbi:MAG: polysaccharide deacetylase family protein [Clostridiaceae bacterium]|nr:polysaccharide deacetylase family protein [Clostridiaceae bacterium]
MSILTTAIGAAKKAKRVFKGKIDSRTPVYLSPVRRIERIKTNERVCAMTFDDGPMNLSPSPDNYNGKPLTLVLLETLEHYGAKGTFDVIGDTSSNYPDIAGKHGSASWGGIAFDHYPDIDKDSFGGAQNCPELIKRILEGGHQITNHTYSHILFGKKSLVYGKRKHLSSLDEVINDLTRLDDLLAKEYGYAMKYMRPPHYVDKIDGGFSSYDACALMGYQYMAASFDGAGWLPCKTYEQEVEAIWKPIQSALLEDPISLCGQIIFQKDGYNMARRTPIADGLPKALEVLSKYGYKVITVDELMERSPFEDIGRDDKLFKSAAFLLSKDYTIVFKNNRVMPDTPLTRGSLAMMIFGWRGAKRRIELMKGDHQWSVKDMPVSHPYSGAVSIALETGAIGLTDGNFSPDKPLDKWALDDFCRRAFDKTTSAIEPLTHGKAIIALAELEGIKE